MSQKFSLKKKIISVGVGSALALSITPVAFGAPISTQSSSSIAITSLTQGSLTQADYRELETLARNMGDIQVANEFAKYANPTRTAGKPGNSQSNVLSSAAKKALVFIIRHAAYKLPAKVQPYAWKIANVVESVTNFQRGAITYALMQAGVPWDVADAAAYWCVVFLGI